MVFIIIVVLLLLLLLMLLSGVFVFTTATIFSFVSVVLDVVCCVGVKCQFESEI